MQLDSFRVANIDEVAPADRIRSITFLGHRYTKGDARLRRIFDLAEFNVGAIRSGGRREGLADLVREALERFFDVLAVSLDLLMTDTAERKITTELVTELVGVINGLIVNLSRP